MYNKYTAWRTYLLRERITSRPVVVNSLPFVVAFSVLSCSRSSLLHFVWFFYRHGELLSATCVWWAVLQNHKSLVDLSTWRQDLKAWKFVYQYEQVENHQQGFFFPSLSCYCEVIWEKAWPLMPNDPPLFVLRCSPILILVTGESFNLQNSTLNDSRRFLFFHSFTSNPCFIVSVRKSGAEGAAVPAAARLVFPCWKQTNTLRRTGVAFRTLSSDSPFRWETETIYLCSFHSDRTPLTKAVILPCRSQELLSHRCLDRLVCFCCCVALEF